MFDQMLFTHARVRFWHSLSCWLRHHSTPLSANHRRHTHNHDAVDLFNYGRDIVYIETDKNPKRSCAQGCQVCLYLAFARVMLSDIIGLNGFVIILASEKNIGHFCRMPSCVVKFILTSTEKRLNKQTTGRTEWSHYLCPRPGRGEFQPLNIMVGLLRPPIGFIFE